ncbi:MAG: Hpt domain-containing protein [Emcibacter sp.]|nr:Hpt domain-containing protein [Emcibacter sp.]
MTKVKFSQRQQDMLQKAQEIIDKEAVSYVEQLRQHIQSLKKSIGSGDITQAIQICHHMQGQAGTFGWPLATEISGWFKRILTNQQNATIDHKTNKIFLSSLENMVKNNLKSHGKEAIGLLQNIEAALKKNNP